MPIAPAEMDLQRALVDAVEEAESAHPGCVLRVETSGDLRGTWDAARLSQVLANLVGNAIHHGAAKTTITITARGEADAVVLRVHNQGPVIPPADLPELFSPFKRLRSGERPATPTSNLGLGLYIVERIVTAHGGTITVSSSAAAGTAFTIRLPR